jgi:hypothetical protein
LEIAKTEGTLAEPLRQGDDPTVRPRRGSNDRCPVDRHRKHKSVVVIGVLADEVHPAGGSDDDRRLSAKPSPESVDSSLLSRHMPDSVLGEMRATPSARQLRLPDMIALSSASRW